MVNVSVLLGHVLYRLLLRERLVVDCRVLQRRAHSVNDGRRQSVG